MARTSFKATGFVALLASISLPAPSNAGVAKMGASLLEGYAKGLAERRTREQLDEDRTWQAELRERRRKEWADSDAEKARGSRFLPASLAGQLAEEDAAILDVISADSRAGNLSLNYANDKSSQQEFDVEFDRLKPYVKAKHLNSVEHVLAAHTLVLAKRISAAIGQPLSGPGVGLSADASSTATLCARLKGASLFAQDGSKSYLGRVEGSFSPESIFNEFGKYGSPFGPSSIWNEFSLFGSDFHVNSARNKFSSAPPKLVKDGKIVGLMSTNKSLPDAIDPDTFRALCKDVL